MSLGKVVRREKFYRVKTSAKIAGKVLGSASKLRHKKYFTFAIILFVSFFGINNFKAVIQESIDSYYVNAQIDNSNPSIDLNLPEISSNAVATDVQNAYQFTSTSNAIFIDKRAYVLDRYMQDHGSPLAGKGQVFVDACDRYGAPRECITTVAIAYNETHLCKYPGSAEMFNCWGYGGGGIYRMTFSSYEEGIDIVTKALTKYYGNKYIEDPSLMDGTFCGNEPGCNGWGNKIKYFMNNIRQYARDLGVDMNS